MEEACTRAPTPSWGVASNTLGLPRTLLRQVTTGSWVGWKSQARWTTTSAPRKWLTRSEEVMSALTQLAFGDAEDGTRRARHTISSTSLARSRVSTRLVPTFPLAPVMTTRIAFAPAVFYLTEERGAAPDPSPAGAAHASSGASKQ